MAKLNYVKYQDKSKNPKKKNKWYARVKHRETLSLADVAKHIAEHGSVYTEDVVMGVLVKLRSCLLEMMLDSKKVKLDGLGTFYIAAKTTPAESAEAFTTANIKSLHIRFLADQSGTSMLTGRALVSRASIQEDNEYMVVVSDSSSSGSGDDGGTVVEQPE